jgi:hypothetical protein
MIFSTCSSVGFVVRAAALGRVVDTTRVAGTEADDRCDAGAVAGAGRVCFAASGLSHPKGAIMLTHIATNAQRRS